jgi:hypothetical protein
VRERKRGEGVPHTPHLSFLILTFIPSLPFPLSGPQEKGGKERIGREEESGTQDQYAARSRSETRRPKIMRAGMGGRGSKSGDGARLRVREAGDETRKYMKVRDEEELMLYQLCGTSRNLILLISH